MSNKPFELGPSAFIEFESVEFGNTSKVESAPVVDAGLDTDPLSINFGRRKEHKPTQAERALAGAAIDWLVAFPIDTRPKALCERFPHVANRLASEWSQTERSIQSLRTLAADTRWGSSGFPAQVQAELERLLQQLTGGRRPA